jgi:hypothetical protein
LYSTDGGDSWIDKSFITYTPISIQVINKNLVFSYYGGRLFRTTDEGQSWTEFSFPVSPPPYPTWIESCFFVNSDVGWSMSNDGRLSVTYDGGLTWSNIYNLGYHYGVFKLHFSDELNGWIHKGSFLQKTTDGGHQWIDRGLTPWANSHPTSHYFLNDTTIFISSGTGLLYKTFDAGITFQSEPLNFVDIDDIYFANIEKGWAVGNNVILASFDAELISSAYEEHITQNLSFYLSQNYPNPFNPSTTITYQIPELSFVTLKVYDVLGNEIATLVNEEKPAGRYEVEFDGTGLPSGIYFYRLQANDFVNTNKMILLK